MSLVKEWLEIAGWTLVSLAICMLFDMGAKYRVELAYVAPAGEPALNATFFSGFTIRHAVLGAIACLLPYIVRKHIREVSPSVVVTGCLLVIYGVLLLRDVFRDIRAGQGGTAA